MASYSKLRAVLCMSIGIGFGAGAVPAAARDAPVCQNRVFVANSFTDTVSIIDRTSNAIIATVPVKTPYDPTLSIDGRHVYVSSGPTGTIAVIDVATNSLVSTLEVGGHPTGLAFTPDGKRLLVTLSGATIEDRGHLGIVDLETGAMSPLIMIGRAPERVTVSPDGRLAYAVNRDAVLTVVDIGRQVVTETIPIGANAFSVLISPRGDKAYLAFIRTDMVGILDLATKKVENVKGGNGPIGLALSRDGGRLLVSTSFESTIQEIATATGKIVATHKVGDRPGLFRVTPDDRFAYVAYSSDKHVGVIDLRTFTEVATITTGGPTSLALC